MKLAQGTVYAADSSARGRDVDGQPLRFLAMLPRSTACLVNLICSPPFPSLPQMAPQMPLAPYPSLYPRLPCHRPAPIIMDLIYGHSVHRPPATRCSRRILESLAWDSSVASLIIAFPSSSHSSPSLRSCESLALYAS